MLDLLLYFLIPTIPVLELNFHAIFKPNAKHIYSLRNFHSGLLFIVCFEH